MAVHQNCPGMVHATDIHAASTLQGLREAPLFLGPCNVGFNRQLWLQRCAELNRHDNSPPYRDEQRAWFDTLRDFPPACLGLQPVARIYAGTTVWCRLDLHKGVEAVLHDALAAAMARGKPQSCRSAKFARPLRPHVPPCTRLRRSGRCGVHGPPGATGPRHRYRAALRTLQPARPAGHKAFLEGYALERMYHDRPQSVRAIHSGLHLLQGRQTQVGSREAGVGRSRPAAELEDVRRLGREDWVRVRGPSDVWRQLE